MKLSDYAKKNGITYRSAFNHWKKGLIEGAYQLPTGTVVIPEKEFFHPKDFVVTYARVSSSENKSNLDSQSERLAAFCAAKGWVVKEQVKEVGSGLDENRPKLLRLLKQATASKIVVEHKDRLTRFGFTYVELVCASFGCEIVVINEVEDKKERLIEDFVSVITCFSAKIYGHRRTKRKTEQIIKEVVESD